MDKFKSLPARLFLLLFLLLGACTPDIVQDSSGEVQDPQTIPETETLQAEIVSVETVTPTDSPLPTETEPPDVTTLCPEAAADTRLYVNREDGYCLLYPSYFEEGTYVEQSAERFRLLGPLLDPNAMETFRVYLIIETNGPADGLDSFQYALKWKDLFADWIEPERETGYIGGIGAVTYRNLPAYGPGEQSAFIVANGFRYRIVLSPQIGDVPELDEHSQLVWDTVTGSIVFFPPEGGRDFVRPVEVCVQPGADTKQYVDLIDGYCLLYPADFEEAADFPGQFVGGPVLEYGTSWGDVRSSLTLGTFGYYPGKTVMEVLDPRADVIDTSSVTETMISGYPAVVFRDARGPWASRHAMIMVDGFVYTIVNQPWEPDRYPEGIPYLDRVWDTVINSLAFFDPWR